MKIGIVWIINFFASSLHHLSHTIFFASRTKWIQFSSKNFHFRLRDKQRQKHWLVELSSGRMCMENMILQRKHVRFDEGWGWVPNERFFFLLLRVRPINNNGGRARFSINFCADATHKFHSLLASAFKTCSGDFGSGMNHECSCRMAQSNNLYAIFVLAPDYNENQM